MTDPASPVPGVTDPHASTGPDSCSCGTPGYTSVLVCGHRQWTHGQPAVKTWLSCTACQGQRKVTAVRPGGFDSVVTNVVVRGCDDENCGGECDG